MAADDIVRLANAANSAEASIWKQALEDEGIKCRMVGENLETALGRLPPGQTEIWVFRADADRTEQC